MELLGTIITAVATIIAAAVGALLAKERIKRKSLEANVEERVDLEADREVERRIRVFDPPPDGSYNTDFYEYFEEVICRARHDIYITGKGFKFRAEDGAKLATSFIGALRYALSQGVRVTRIQTKAETDPEWARLLSEMLKDFGDRFRFFVLTRGRAAQITSVCVIDPNDPIENITEIMLSMKRISGTESADVAGTAIFIHGKDTLAKSVRDGILQLKDNSIEIKTPEEVQQYLVRKQLYFAYGSNMETDQMTKRCPSAEKVGVGLLKDHSLVFNRKGTYRTGGVGSIERQKGERVYGVIWRISLDDLLRLDETEDPNAYQRERLSVSDLQGERYDCHIYKAIPEGQFEPDPTYLCHVTTAAREAGLPDEYILKLKSLGRTEGKRNSER